MFLPPVDGAILEVRFLLLPQPATRKAADGVLRSVQHFQTGQLKDDQGEAFELVLREVHPRDGPQRRMRPPGNGLQVRIDERSGTCDPLFKDFGKFLAVPHNRHGVGTLPPAFRCRAARPSRELVFLIYVDTCNRNNIKQL